MKAKPSFALAEAVLRVEAELVPRRSKRLCDGVFHDHALVQLDVIGKKLPKCEGYADGK